MQLTSPAFDDGETIPRRRGYARENTNPPLSITDVPPEAESYFFPVAGLARKSHHTGLTRSVLLAELDEAVERLFDDLEGLIVVRA